VDNPNLKWPKVYVTKKGAFPFRDVSDLMEKLEAEHLIASLAEIPRQSVVQHAN
jgi:hypothetical protein